MQFCLYICLRKIKFVQFIEKIVVSFLAIEKASGVIVKIFFMLLYIV